MKSNGLSLKTILPYNTKLYIHLSLRYTHNNIVILVGILVVKLITITLICRIENLITHMVYKIYLQLLY